MKSSMLMNALLFVPHVASSFDAPGESDYRAATMAACAADATCRLEEGLPDPAEHKVEDDFEGFGLFPERMPLQLLSTEAKTAETSERLGEEEMLERMARLRRELEGIEGTLMALSSESAARQTVGQQTSGAGSPSCDSPCTFKRQTHTCRERTQWIKDHWDVASFQDPSGYGKSLEIVNGDCAGQCSCNPYDFGVVYVKDVLPPLTKLVCQGLDVGCPAPPPPPPRPTPKPTPAPPTPAPKPTGNGTATPAPTPKPVQAAGACSADDFASMNKLGAGSKKGSFAETVSTCARGAYSLWYGLSQDKDQGCLRKKIGISGGCAECIHKANQFGTKHCKVACIKSWCSESCLKCSMGYKPQLESCTGGGALPAAEVCVKTPASSL
eukprot:TRINITY_DN3197_c0_g1_i1.p1 TRINITY_DN3197_c0_g1~~TRINITY_DN3197_c0_g1_i1.p1  ORF type:complete len:383 (-),score=82.36 TRINITY_DN3197_c0_g1_i1:284-1432(-)